MGTAGLSSLLDQGIEQSTDMLVHDLSATGRAWWASKAAKNAPSPTLLGHKFQGRQVHQGENFIWTRNGSGPFHTLQGHRVLDDAAITQLAAMTAAPAPTVASAPAEQAAAPAAVPAAAPATDGAAAPVEAAAAPVGSGN